MRTQDALLRRGTAHRAALAVAFATVLLTLTVTTAVALLHRAADDAAVTGVLAEATAAERVVRLSAELEDDTDLEALDERARATLTSALSPAEPVLTTRTVSASYALPGPDAEEPDLTVFATYGDELTRGAQLVEGSWPSGTSSSGPVEVAMPRPAAEAVGRASGDRWTVLNRFTDEPVDVQLTGLFIVADPEAPAWLGDPLVTRGVETRAFTTFGPLVVSPAMFADRFLDEATGTWTADPQLAEVQLGQLPRLRAGVAGVEEPPDGSFSVETDLSGVLDRVEIPLAATRATVVMAAAPLVLLAVAALLAAGRLLADRRLVELALLRARGASTTQLATVGVAEALALTVPATLLAPPAAQLLVGGWGPARAEGGGLPAVDGTTWALAALAGVVAALALALPSWRREDLTVAVRSAAGSRRAVQRLGADLLVVGAAAVGAWQLARYDGPLRAGEADPLLVTAPAALLLVGCLVALRVLPGALRVAQPWAARSRGLTGALATWTVSRQHSRQVGPLLTVLLSASVVAFSATWLSSWDRSVADQAAFATGADVVVQDPEGMVTSTTLAELPGVEALMPLTRSTDSFGDAPAELLAVHAAAAGAVVALRDDLADRPVSALLAPLADKASRAGLPLPAGTAALDLLVPTAGGPVDPVAVVQDGTGVLHAFPFRRADPTARARAELAPLPGPLRLLGIQHRSDQGAGVLGQGDPALRTVDAAGHRGARLALPRGTSWQSRQAVTPGTTLLLAGEPADDALPAVVTQGLAATLGDQDLVVDTNGLSLRLQVVGTVDGLPSVHPHQSEGMLVDLTAMNQVVLAQSGSLPVSVPEYWLEVGDHEPAATAAAAAELPEVTVVDRQSRLRSIESGPVGTAVVGVLTVALVSALLAALSGVVASAAAGGQARRREGALLRAVGAGPRQLARLAILDRTGLLTVAGLTGGAVGVAVAWWTLPRIALTDGATAPYPPLLVAVPWTSLALGAAAALVAGLLLHLWSARRRARAEAPERAEEPP